MGFDGTYSLFRGYSTRRVQLRAESHILTPTVEWDDYSISKSLRLLD